MRSVACGFWIIVAVVGGGLAGAMPIFVMGLSVPMFLVGPLALLTGALLASLAGGWAANFTFPRQTRSRIWAIFCTLVLASMGALALGFGAAGVINAQDIPLGIATDLAVYLPGIMLFMIVSLMAVWNFRTPVEEGLRSYGVLALALSGLWPLFATAGTVLGMSPVGIIVSVGAFVLVFVGSVLAVITGVVLYRRSAEPGSDRRSLNTDAAFSLGLVGVTPLFVGATLGLGCTITTCLP